MYDLSSDAALLTTACQLPDSAAPLVGREDDLIALDRRFAQNAAFPDGSTARVVALTGPAGVGKTQLALAFAKQQTCRIVWWIDASPGSDPVDGLFALARALNLIDHNDEAGITVEEMRRRLFTHLSLRTDWLLIYDNLERIDRARHLWPKQRSGRVLVTSRSPNWAEIAAPLPVNILPREASIDLLRRRSGRNESDAVADRLATALGDLPLALEQAAALINHTRISFADYLAKFETQWAELLAAGRPSPQYPLSLVMSWELSFRPLEAASPEAAALLSFCSMLAPTEIPRTLLDDAARFAPPPLDHVLSNPVLRDQAIGSLVEFGLADANEFTLKLHSVAGALASVRLEESQRTLFAAAAADTMRSLFVFDDRQPINWPRLASLLPHAQAAAAHADRARTALVSVRMIYNSLGLYWLTLGHLREAQAVLERALAIATELWGEKSARLSPIANNLGRVLLRRDDAASALARFDQALAIDEAVYGRHHPHISETLNNRGVAKFKLGDVEGADLDFIRALRICERVTVERGRRATLLNNAGYILLSRNDLPAAAEQFVAALLSAEQELGETHPTLAAILHNLADTRQLQGEPRDARSARERARSIQRDTSATGPAPLLMGELDRSTQPA